VADWGIPEPGLVESWWMLETALHDHAITVTYSGMTGHAINVVALLPSFEKSTVKLEACRQFIPEGVAMLAAQEITVGVELLAVKRDVRQARDRSVDGKARRAPVRKELA
jgi:hypothetical protein